MLTARLRMVHLPINTTRVEESQIIYVSDDLWVPIVVANGNVHILPGIPRVFEKLLDCLKPVLLPRLTDPDGKGMHMIMFSTPLAESAVAPYLTELAARVEPREIKVGSYPRWGRKKNTVTLVGRDRDYMESLVGEIEKCVQGRRINVEGEDDSDNGEDKAT
jgi:molybdopterin-biosynthesis enzyme MoeA-like protein